MNLKRSSIFISVCLILALTFSMFFANTTSVGAQNSQTPTNWINLITQTPGGAWLPTSGITNYPWTCSPGGNSERTSYTASPGPQTNHTLWRKDLALHNWAFGVVDKGAVYTVSMDQNALYALDANTGETLWQYNLPLALPNDTGNQILGPWNNDNFVHLMGNLVLAGWGDARKTMAVGLQSGNLEWLSPEASRVSLVCPPGTVFANSYAAYLTSHNTDPIVTTCYKFTYDEQTRIEKVWESANVGERISYYDGKVYGAPDASKWVSCANAATGDLVWNFTLPASAGENDVFYQHPVIAEGRAYFPLETNKLEVLDANTGDFLWEHVTEGDYLNNVAVSNGKLYVAGGSEAKLYCLDAANGNKIWEFQAAGPLDYYNPIIAGDKVYFSSAAAPYEGFPLAGTYAGYMYCVNADTGAFVWKYLTPQTCVNVWTADGNLYSPTPFHQIWCWGAGPTTTSISVTSSQSTSGQNVVISGSVTDMSPFSQQYPGEQSPLVSGAQVILSYVKDGTWTDFATTSTASDGSFMQTWTPPNEGTYKIVARFEGTNDYKWSSGQAILQVGAAGQASSTLSETTLLLFFAVAVIVILAAIAIAVVVLRRKPT
jgi:outer membrane protein assembly factor BamB